MALDVVADVVAEVVAEVVVSLLQDEDRVWRIVDAGSDREPA
jgi:hypothetical protein